MTDHAPPPELVELCHWMTRSADGDVTICARPLAHFVAPATQEPEA